MKKLIIFVTLVLAVSVIINLRFQAQAEEQLKADFKKLEQKDYDIQENLGEVENLEQAVRKVYCDPEAKKVLSNLKEMKEKGIYFELSSIDYQDIEVLEQGSDSAFLLIKARPKGSYFTIKEPHKKVKELVTSVEYEVHLSNMEDNGWRIKEVIFKQ